MTKWAASLIRISNHEVETLQKRLAEIVEEEGGQVEWREEDVLVHFRDGERKVRDDIPAVTTKFVSLVSDLWIRFELNGFRYYFEVSDNPYFPDGYIKTPVGWDGETYIDKIEEKLWMLDGIFGKAADEDTIERSAVILLDQLEDAHDSRKF